MRRIKLVLAVVAAMALMTAAAAAPAMAAVFHNGHNHGFVVFNDDNDFFDHHDFFFPNNFENFPVASQGIENESESGDVDLSFSVGGSDNNSNQCVTPLQFGNTGNFQNAQGFTSFGSPFNNNFDNGFFDNRFFFPNDVFGTDVEFEGGTFEFAPVLSGGCTQSVEQSSAASSG